MDRITQKISEAITYSLAGGATKFIGIAQAAILLLRLGYVPKVIVGLSAGAIVGLFLALGIKNPKWLDLMIEIGRNLKQDEIFDFAPTDENGNIKLWAIVRIFLFGKPSLGVQNIRKLIERYFNEEDFREYQKSPECPPVYVLAVSNNRKHEGLYFNLKDDWINWERLWPILQGTSRIPLYTEGVKIWVNERGKFIECVDGGIRHHNAGNEIIDFVETDHLVSVHSRPKGFKLDGLTDEDKGPENIITWLFPFFRDLLLLIDGLKKEASRSDEELEYYKCKDKKINLTQVFLPWKIESQYGTDKDQLEALLNGAKEAVYNRSFYDFKNGGNLSKVS